MAKVINHSKWTVKKVETLIMKEKFSSPNSPLFRSSTASSLQVGRNFHSRMSAILKFFQENVRQKLNLRPSVQENPVLHFRYALKSYLKCRTGFSWTHGHHFVFFFHFHNALISQVFVLKNFILEHWNYKNWHQEVEVSELRVFQSEWHQEVELSLNFFLSILGYYPFYMLNEFN